MAKDDERTKSKVLTEEKPLLIPPKLAAFIGLNEAIILQQIHYWITVAAENKKNYKEGYFWTYNSIKQWQEQFPFWSEITIKRTIKSLEDKEILISASFNKLPIDRTKWYRIDYEALSQYLSRKYQHAPMDSDKLTLCDWVNLTQPLPETSLPETSTEIVKQGSELKTEIRTISFNQYLEENPEADKTAVEVISYFLHRYEEERGEDHPHLKPEKWDEQIEMLFSVYDESEQDLDGLSISEETWEAMIDKYFKCKFRGFCNYQLPHFNRPAIKAYRFYEVGY